MQTDDYEQTFSAPNELWFSVRDAFVAIADFEKVARQSSEWFGAVDMHHVFFEGMFKTRGGKYSIGWGS